MTEVQYGSIEVIVGDESYGYPITPLNPLVLGSAVPTQIKNRTGVQAGAKQADLTDDAGEVVHGHKGRWEGRTKAGAACEVRIWETAGV